MAVFCDFENVALGVRDANYENFDISMVLERLLDKGSIVVKKAYCDWERYKSSKAPMHEAAFELIEIPHVRHSGKNSADIRLVVDALDLCYTKSHVDTFVIVSGDSDFSPLVSKLRENDKTVIGMGVKSSTSDLLIANCDEFIYYDDLVREKRRNAQAKAQAKSASPPAPGSQGGAQGRTLPPAGGGRAGRGSADTPAAVLSRTEEGLWTWCSPTIEALAEDRGGEPMFLGLDGQADPQAPQARLQREVLRFPRRSTPCSRKPAPAAWWNHWSTTRNPAATRCGWAQSSLQRQRQRPPARAPRRGHFRAPRSEFLVAAQIAPLACRQPAQRHAAAAHALQPGHREADQFAHPADLPLLALAQHEAQLVLVLP